MNGRSSSFFITGGTMRPDAPSYVERQADKELQEGLQAAEFCHVLTSRQMGKSSLMVRTAARLRETGTRVAVLDLTAIGQNLTAEQWYDGLMLKLGEHLGAPDAFEDFWQAHSHLGPCQRLFAAIQQAGCRPAPTPTAAPARSEAPLVIFVDEIDVVRSLPFPADEFFAAIRECYNRRTQDSEMQRLTFCLIGVASPSDLLRDTRLTPFNVGRRIEVNDFTSEEALPLAQGLTAAGTVHGPKLLSRVLHWTNGHPYLTQRMCQALVEQEGKSGVESSPLPETRVDSICKDIFFNDRARDRDDNLVFVRERLLRSGSDCAGVLQLYDRVLRHGQIRDDERNALVALLRSAGIVRATRGQLMVRNRIYARAFDREWVKANMPDAEIRRQKQAFWRGVIRTTAIAAVVVGIVGSAALFAMRKAAEARYALAESFYSQAKALALTGITGHQVESLKAIRKALQNANDVAKLRDQAIACLALTDLEPEVLQANLPTNSTRLALHPGLQSYAVAHDQGRVRVRSLTGQEVVAELPAQDAAVMWMRVSSKGRFLAAQYERARQPQFLLWDLLERKSVLQYSHWIQRHALDFSPDDTSVAIAIPEIGINLHSLPDGSEQQTLRRDERLGFPRVPTRLRFDPSGTRLADCSAASKDVLLWDLKTNTSTNLNHRGLVVALAWAPDGNQLATVSESHTLSLWDLQIHRRRDIPRAHSGTVLDLAFSPCGPLLASLSADMTLKLWVPATGRPMTHSLGAEPSGDLFFSADGRKLGLVSGGMDFQLFSLRGPDQYQVYRQPVEEIADFRSLCFSLDGRVLIGANDLGAFLWDTELGGALPILLWKSIRSAFVHPVSGDLLTTTPSGLQRWRKLSSTSGAMPPATFGPAELLAPGIMGRCNVDAEGSIGVTIRGNRLYRFQFETPSAFSELPGTGNYQEVKLSPDGQWLAAWKTVPSLIDVLSLDPSGASGTNTHSLPGSRHFAFSPDGRFLALCWDRAYRFYQTGTWAKALEPIPRAAFGDTNGPLAFAKAGSDKRVLLAVTETPTVITLYDFPSDATNSARLVARLESPDRFPIVTLVFSRDGNRLAAATTDQTIQVWNLARIRSDLEALGLEQTLPKFPSGSKDMVPGRP